jgi:hypothetical protein
VEIVVTSLIGGRPTSMAKIKNCPNPTCGSDDLKVVPTAMCAYYFVECGSCYMSGPHGVDGDAAIDLWNALSTRYVIGGPGISRKLGSELVAHTPSTDLSIKECPNCNRSVALRKSGFVWHVSCALCLASGPHDWDIYRAVEGWNALFDPASDWISVNDRLPNPGEYVHAFSQVAGHLVAFRDLSTEKWRGRTLDGIHWHDYTTITHWEYFRPAPGSTLGEDEPLESGWISVEDDLPETSEFVLVCDPYESTPLMGFFAQTDNKWYVQPTSGKWKGQRFEMGTDGTITHWQPLPALPNLPTDEPTSPEMDVQQAVDEAIESLARLPDAIARVIDETVQKMIDLWGLSGGSE